jgi:hypothetical protein
VGYTLSRGAEAKPFAKMPNTSFNATTLPAEFNLSAGHQVLVVQGVPLASFAPGDRLAIASLRPIAGHCSNGVFCRSIGGSMRPIALSLFVASIGAGLWGQTSTVALEPVTRQMPTYVQERLSASDRVLFDKLMRVGIESAWSLVTAAGYPQNFINELSQLKPNHRMVGRARTMRYLPNRKDVREKLYKAAH